MREIVTVQVGGFANFVGSHFWNFQDEMLGLAADPYGDPIFKTRNLNMDVLYRTGETRQGTPTYTPRLVSVDLQGSLGSLSSHGTLYDEDSPATSNITTWTCNVSTHASEPHKKNLFLQRMYEEQHNDDSHNEIHDKDIVESLDKDVQFWTDFSKVHYHHRSLYELNGLWFGDQEFDNYGMGKDVFQENSRGEEICDRLRFFVEECDHIQGFQFIVDEGGGFSALATDFLETIADEYTNIPVLLYAVRGYGSRLNMSTRKHRVFHDLHDSVSFSRLSSFCKMIVPIGLPFFSSSKASKFLKVEDQKAYHSSAVYAAAIHSASLPFLMEPQGPSAESLDVAGHIDVNGVLQILTGQARQNMVPILDIAIPAPCFTEGQKEHTLLESLWPLTPEVSEDMEDPEALEIMAVHGAFGADGSKAASVVEIQNAVHTAYGNATSRPRFCHLSVSRCPLPIPLPFPPIFSGFIGKHGGISGSPTSGLATRSSSLNVHSVPMVTRFRSTSAILPYLEKRLQSLRKLCLEHGALGAEIVRSWGFGKDEMEDMGETLSKMVSAIDPQADYVSSDSD